MIEQKGGNEIDEIKAEKKETEVVIRTCGWFLRHDFRSSARRPRAIPDIFLSIDSPQLLRFEQEEAEKRENDELARFSRFVCCSIG